jgi:hypothetical protein
VACWGREEGPAELTAPGLGQGGARPSKKKKERKTKGEEKEIRKGRRKRRKGKGKEERKRKIKRGGNKGRRIEEGSLEN